MYSMDLHFDVTIWKNNDSNYVASTKEVVFHDGNAWIVSGVARSDPHKALNSLMSVLRQDHPDINIHLHLVKDEDQ